MASISSDIEIGMAIFLDAKRRIDRSRDLEYRAAAWEELSDFIEAEIEAVWAAEDDLAGVE